MPNQTETSPPSATAKKPIIKVESLCKSFGSLKAIDNVSFEILENEFFSLLGPSGCGKTTLLRMLAGFEFADSGHIIIDGKDMSKTPPNKRPINMVFQTYAVFPHMNVMDNVAYGLKMQKIHKGEIEDRVYEALKIVHLHELIHRMPSQLSGGQRQRVALARALILQPKLLLLDEPLSALDAKLRESMQMELRRLQHDIGITFVVVTHDQSEALGLSNRIAIMNKGRIEQIDKPSIVYERPNNFFTADFIGSLNKFIGKIDKTGQYVESPLYGEKMSVQQMLDNPNPPKHKQFSPNETISVALRPERIFPQKGKAPKGALSIKLVITGQNYQGNHILYYAKLASDSKNNTDEMVISVPQSADASAENKMFVDDVHSFYFYPENIILLKEKNQE